MVLAVLCGLLLILFQGVTDRLIPLYAVGAFMAFTLSQAGMVQHWRKKRGPHWLKSALINGLGAFVTGITVIVVLVAKFIEGAWITLLFIPLVLILFRAVRRHYHEVTVDTSCRIPMTPKLGHAPPLVVVPFDRWSAITRQALEFGSRLSPDMIALHVEPGEHSELLHDDWERYVVSAYQGASCEAPKLEILPSPYRFIILPIVQYILALSEQHPDRKIIVMIPELVEYHWYEYFLHNQRGRLLEWLLLVKGNQSIFTVSSPYYLSLPLRKAPHPKMPPTDHVGE